MEDLVGAAGIDAGSTPPPADGGDKTKEGTPPGEGSQDGNNGEGSPPPEGEQKLWHWDDKRPGEGEVPEWLKSEKYKTVADQAKAYNELTKKLGGFVGAPEEYDLEIPDLENVKLSSDDPVLKDFMDFAKESNMSQETFNGIIQKYVGVVSSTIPDPKAEMEKLGLNAKAEIERVATVASNNLTPDEFQQFRGLMTTADNIRMFNKLIAKTTAPDVSQGKPAHTTETKAQLEKMMMDDRYYKDEDFRKTVRDKLARITG